MISILYDDRSNGKPYLGCWTTLDPQTPDDLGFGVEKFNDWLKQHNASFREGDHIFYIDFEDEQDAIVFKLKYGI